MAEILKEWLTERLNRPIKWDPEEFGEMMKDGHIIADLLFSYHVISEEKCFLIRSSKAIEDITSNWKNISAWLRDIDVYLSDAELAGVIEGKGPVLLRVFYMLFLQLDRRDRTNFIKQERKMVSNLVEKMGNRFKVNKNEEEANSTVDDLSKPLLDESHYIEWQRKKEEEVKQSYENFRHRYKKMAEKIMESQTPLSCTKATKPVKLTSKDKHDIEQFCERFPCKYENYTYDELLELEKIVDARKQSLVDTDWAKNYMENLHVKFNNKSDSEEIQKQIRNELSASLWDLTISEEETKLDTELAKKVMKLSQFEKQMCTQIMETKQQTRNLVLNRIKAEIEFNDQRNDQFCHYLESIKDKLNLEINEIDYEWHRQNVRHEKLYAEKMRKKRQSYYKICYDTVLALVDYASKYANGIELIGSNEIPAYMIREWKRLFFKNQPIFNILESVEDILEGEEEQEFAPEEIELRQLELDRQDTLNSFVFEEYNDYTGPWNLASIIPKYDPETDERKLEYLGSRIFGHVVYTLLNIKYPFPPTKKPANLPNFSVKAILRSLPDRALTVPIQKLLSYRNIHVTRTETAINYCMKYYKDEMMGTDVAVSYEKLAALVGGNFDDNKEVFKLMKAEEETYTKDLGQAGPSSPNTKQTQTPKTIPEEDIILPMAAELGKYAYEELSSGRALTDHLVSAMLVEYLKDQGDIKGFVIINYPNTYTQAQILEEIFSGRAPADENTLDDTDDIYLEESISKYKAKEKDRFKHIRVSKLVKDPHKKNIESPFESYFTCYIKLKETPNILKADVIWNLTRENSELIDRFYSVLGLNYSMYYEFIDKEFLAQVCKYIIGDLSYPLKDNDYFFGPSVLSLLDFATLEDRRYKHKILKPDLSFFNKSKEQFNRMSRLSRNFSRTGSIVKNRESKDLVNSEITSNNIKPLHEPTEVALENHPGDVATPTNKSKSYISVEDVKVGVGEEDWVFSDIPIIENIGRALASYWEEAEKSYIHDMEELFFAKRLIMNSLEPYARFIRERIEQVLTLPSNKQDIVNAFQKTYNDFESDFRLVDAAKKEWHCRVRDFQKELYNICDSRKIFAEKQRHAIILDNWTMEELTSMVNTYISCMQTELNRFYISYQLMHDFYLSMLKRYPPNDRISTKELIKITRELEEVPANKKPIEEKLFRHIKTAFIELQQKSKPIDASNNPFYPTIEQNVKLALKYIKDTNDSYKYLINRESNEVSKITLSVKRKEDYGSPFGSEIIHNSEETLKENRLKCIEEWKVGINGEMCRTNQRIVALQYKCYQDMQIFVDYIYKSFMTIQKNINTYYLNEIKSVDRLCKYIQIAIEQSRKIPESLLLEHDTFVIDPNLIQYDPAPPSETGDVEEVVTNVNFKMSQLANFRNHFKMCAPMGLCLQQTFIYLLQDFLFYSKETGEKFPYPEIWKQIDPEDIPKLVYIMFGDTAYVDWREFLIYCLNIRFPNLDELVELRETFRCQDLKATECISREKFLATKLWFENDYDPQDKVTQLRVTLIKHFIFELFETSPDMINYSALLLAFCKDTDPVEGFVMALTMAVGEKICIGQKECEEAISQMIEDKRYNDACLNAAHSFVQKFLATVIENVINITVGTVISDVECTFVISPQTPKKLGKKLTARSKRSLSARESRAIKSYIKSKSVSSTGDLKPNTTYICSPCGDDIHVPEKEDKSKVHEELIKPASIPIDMNLIYSVNQDVIWRVLKICLPWHFQLLPEVDTENVIPYVEDVKNAITLLTKDTDDGSIYVSKFVKDPSVCKLLHRVKRFTAISLVDVVKQLNQ